jgi:hypothetical protein
MGGGRVRHAPKHSPCAVYVALASNSVQEQDPMHNDSNCDARRLCNSKSRPGTVITIVNFNEAPEHRQPDLGCLIGTLICSSRWLMLAQIDPATSTFTDNPAGEQPSSKQLIHTLSQASSSCNVMLASFPGFRLPNSHSMRWQ